ncbi:MAG: MBL fold metallo-hydrolase [Bacteroidales bacterium]|nr:MBL fold metallo-hydrolase [Bacteroidales bacterium]
MSKERDNRSEPGRVISAGNKIVRSELLKIIMLFTMVISGFACTRTDVPSGFNPSRLKQLGDSIHFGSYIVYKIGDRVYKICDPGTPGLKGGGLVGVDVYIICGKEKALMIDLGNNYIDGYAGDLITPRENAKEEFLEVVNGLIGNLPLDVGVTHMHPDHSGMTKAFLGSSVPLFIGEGEDMERFRTMHAIDPSVYQIFRHGEKTFDLGGGRTVKTFLVRGHSNGGTVFLLMPDMMLFTGDAISPGPRRKRELRSAEAFGYFKEDINKLVYHIKDNFAPYDRYRLQVYTGHSAEMIFHVTKTDLMDTMLEDAGYGDWRFVQDMANCVNGIASGIWLDEASGWHHFEVAPGRNGEKQIQIVYYLGAVIIPEEVAYAASGMKVPE